VILAPRRCRLLGLVGCGGMRAVTVRVGAEEWTTLQAAAAEAGVPASRVARVLLRHGIEALRGGDAGITRAVKSSRDG